MTKNPFLNALAAAAYIGIVGSLMFYTPKLGFAEPSFLIPIAMISLLTFSVALMGFVFLKEPLTMYIDGQKKESVSLIAKTIASFGVITILFFLILLALN